MAFFTSAVDILKIVVTAIGAGMAVIGIIIFLLGNNSNDAGQKTTGINMMMAGGGIALVGQMLVPQLANLFS